MVGDLWAAMAWTVSAGFDRDDQGPGEVRGRELLPMPARHRGRALVPYRQGPVAAGEVREGRGRVAPYVLRGVR